MPPDPKQWLATRRFDIGFFDDTRTQAVIELVARAPKITLYVGAGASIDQGLPAWGQLVSQLLASRVRVAPEYPISPGILSETGAVASALTKAYGEVATASLVDALYMHEHATRADAIRARNRDIAHVMYTAQAPTGVEPGYLSTYIAYLAATFQAYGRDVEIATTNYDLGLEETIQSNPTIQDLLQESSKLTGNSSSPHNVTVEHLHGRVSRGGTGQGVVFSEIEYASSTQTDLLDYLRKRTSDSGLVLIIGSSLRDTDLVAALAALSSESSWDKNRAIGLLPIQDELKGIPNYDPAHFSGDIRDYISARGEDFGLSILRPDFYGQVYQFLQEVANSLRLGDKYVSYERRLRQWWNTWEGPVYANVHARRQVTEELQAIVVDHLPDLRSTTTYLKVELWVRSDPDTRLFELWCSSQSMWLSKDAHRPHQAAIATDSEYVAVSCFAQRVPLRGSMRTTRPGRWTHFVAVPVLLSQDPYMVLPVGVAIAFFDAPAAEGDDLRDPSNVYEFNRLEEDLLTIGLRAFSPSFADGLVDA